MSETTGEHEGADLLGEHVEPAPDEIQHDAIEELDRIHRAQQFSTGSVADYDQSYQMSQGSGDFPLPYETRERESRAVPVSRELKTLEDLYDAYPHIGDGSHYLRVMRTHPTNFAGHRVSGFLEDIHDQITLAEFAKKFGGHVYEVSVRGPGRGNAIDADGRAVSRTLTTIKIQVPGTPVVKLDSNGGGTVTTPYPTAEGERVQLRRMDIENEALQRSEQRAERLARELQANKAMPTDVIQQMHQMAEHRVKETRSVHAEIISQLRNDNSRMTATIQEKDRVIDGLREQIVEVKTETQRLLQEQEGKQVRELKMQHEIELRRYKEEQANTITRQQQDHERRLNEITERNARECEAIRQNESRERERLRDDAARREKSLADDHTRREQIHRDQLSALRDELTRREESLRRDYESRFDQQERAMKRDLEIIRSSESTKSELSSKTAEVQVRILSTQIEQLNAEKMSIEQEAMELRQQQNKPLMQQIEESHKIADMTGYKMGEKNKDFDWKEGAVEILKGVSQKLPEIAKGFGEARENNRMAVEQARHQAQIAQGRAMEAQRRQQMAAFAPQGIAPLTIERPERQVRRPVPPPGMGQPRSWDSGPNEASNLPPEPSGPPRYEPPRPPVPVQGGRTVDSPPPPITGGYAPPVTPANPSGHPSDMIVPSTHIPTQTVDTHEPGPGLVWSEQSSQASVTAPNGQQLSITPEQVQQFGAKLEAAIRSDIITAEMFAEGMIQEIGPDVARAIVGSIDPTRFIEEVERRDPTGSSLVVTRDGRAYIHKLWAEARRLLS